MIYVSPIENRVKDLNEAVFPIIIKREHLKRNKEYSKCDEIRDFLSEIGVKIKDINFNGNEPFAGKHITEGWEIGEFLFTDYDIDSSFPDTVLKDRTKKALDYV